MMRKPTDNIEYYELTITAGKYIKTIPICFPTDAAPFPAVLCLCESNYLYNRDSVKCKKRYGSDEADVRCRNIAGRIHRF